MSRVPAAVLLVALAACSRPPAPEVIPEPVTAPAGRVTGSVQVTASTLNVRAGASANDEIVTRVRRGTRLDVIEESKGWLRVRLASGQTGWVSSQHVSRGDAAPRRRGCPPNSDYSFVKAPVPAFSDSDSHGLVVIEAAVNTAGVVTSTKVTMNSTGDPALAALAEREIRSATFRAPVVNCVTRSFIFTYKRSF
ncbi:MAG TPA: SH3 domain-containing protein [Thermoanaerobaculia bacterium]|nr:SH3 domain-containing protein [Thermoanaerobaculia bacterium]